MGDRPLLKRVLTRRKPMWMFRYERQINELQQTIEELKDQLEESNIENARLRGLLKSGSEFTIPVQLTRTQSDAESSETVSPQFKLSM